MIELTDGIIFLAENKKMLFINQKAKDILNIVDACEDPKGISNILSDACFIEGLEEFFKNNTPVYKEFNSQCFKNKIFSFSIESCSDSIKVHEDKVYAILILKDLTKIKQLESLQRDFITNVSHELRTPLTSIRMAAESLQMGAISDNKLKNKFLSNIQREADRLTRLVNELLVLAELDNKPTLHLSTFDPILVLQDVITTMEHHAALNDIKLVADFPVSLPLLEGDKDRIQQVLINLVDNAIKCNKPNGTVTLKAVQKDKDIEIRVIDTGIGIPAIDVLRIFDRFFRVDKARSRVTGGTGLGLSIVKDLITAHGGTITVQSTIDVGTTFIITLPNKIKL